jgi:lambda family phage tail tape measure protein
MAIISRLAVLLGLDAGEFNANLGKAKDSVTSFAASAKIPLLAVAAAFAASSREAVMFADRINDVAKANDMSVQSVLRMSQALSTNGGNSDDAGKLMASFANKIDEAADGSTKAQKAFLSIGVSLKDLRQLAPQELFEKTIKALAGVEDTAKRNALAMDMFGRAIRGVDIKGMADEFEKTKNKFAGSDETFKSIGNSVDRLDRFFLNLKVTLANAVAPAFESLTIAMENWQARSKGVVDRFQEIKKEAGWWAAWKDKEGIGKYVAPSERDFGSVQGANVPGIMSGIGGIAAPKKDVRQVELDKEKAAELKRINELIKKQQEFYEKEMLISQAKGERLQKENELAFATENERKLQLEIYDIEQKRKQLTIGDQFGRKMTDQQADAWMEAEKARAREAYSIAESQRTFEYGWKKAFASYVDSASNAARMGEQAFVSVTQNLESALDKFVETGKLSFSDLARSIISDLIKIELKAQAMSLFKSSGLGGLFGSLFGGFGGSSPAFGSTAFWGGKAEGGEVTARNSYMVGEKGPELFIPKGSGTIIPNGQLGSMGGSGPSVVYNGPYIANMNAIDTQSATQFLAKNKQAVWSANQSAQRSLPQSR